MARKVWTAKQLKRIPELRYFGTDERIARQWTDYFDIGWWVTGAASMLGMAVWTLACVVVVGATMTLVKSVDIAHLIFFGAFLVWAIGLWVAACFGDFVIHRRTLRKLRSELRRRGIPVCIRCGYEGGDIHAPRCPECGTPASS